MNTNFPARLSVITVIAIGLLGCSKSSSGNLGDDTIRTDRSGGLVRVLHHPVGVEPGRRRQLFGSTAIAKRGDLYALDWAIASSPAYHRVGIVEGGVFGVGWGTAGKGAGAVAYTVGSKLDGKWAQPKGTSLGTEVLGKN
jgi:hypothetical protein